MGFLRKTIKRIGRGIKKIGKKIGKAFKEVMKPFTKVFGKLGPIGSIAMMMILPGVGQLLSGFGANIAAGTSIFGKVGAFGQTIGTAVKFMGNAINYVASAPRKILGSITDAIGRGWNVLSGAPDVGGPSWFDNFKADFGSGSFDVSAAGQENIRLFGNEVDFFKTSRAGLTPDAVPGGTETFSTAGTVEPISPNLDLDIKPVSPSYNIETGEITGGTMADATPTITGTTSATDYVPPSQTGSVPEGTGVLGRARAGIKSKVGSIAKTKIPYVGTVGDTAWAANAGLTAYQAYGSVVGADGQLMPGSSSYAYEAQELLGPTGDAGGMYNITAPTWSYDYNQSYTNNMTNAQNVWNNYYGFGQGFDPSATPGYGYGYEQWLLDSMGMRVSGGAP